MTISSDSVICKQVQLCFLCLGDLDFSMDLPGLKLIPTPDPHSGKLQSYRVQGLQKAVSQD